MNKKEKDYKFLQNIIELSKNLEMGYLDLGKYLMECRDEERFKPVYESFDDFCLEIKKSPATISKLIGIYQYFNHIPKERLAEAGGWSTLAELLPVITSQQNAKKWVDKAVELTRNDLRKEVKEAKTGIPMAECKHTDTYEVEICRMCGDAKRKMK